MGYTLYNIDLKRDEQNYICFSGWFLSKNPNYLHKIIRKGRIRTDEKIVDFIKT